MSKTLIVIGLLLLVCGISLRETLGQPPSRVKDVTGAVVEHDDFDVIIAGGSTAAFAAAIASAESGAKTALLEPTDWVGGQLTASGVPAVDEAWHKINDSATGETLIDVSQWARDPRNITPNFLKTLQGIKKDCGDCWVSRYCFRPRIYLETQLRPLIDEQKANLTVFYETVVKQVDVNDTGSAITSITAIRRQSVAGNGYDQLPSVDLADWYSPKKSARFHKEVLRFGARKGQPPIFMDATEWGEVLALSGADYLQGAETTEGAPGGNETCGQSTVFCFIQKLHAESVDPPPSPSQTENSSLGFGKYQEKKDAWKLIWTYRRVRGKGEPAPGDLCLQNWEYSDTLKHGGNDHVFGYLFKSRAKTDLEANDWNGGINVETLAAAEQRAFAWHEWFRQHTPAPFHADQFTLAGDELGTSHGLAKLPYIRDTRRAIGLDGFILKVTDLTGSASQKTGTVFTDRIALGAYPIDIHPLDSCDLPVHARREYETLPFYLPFRALTHYQFDNLLVAGKTMAQSFLANSATRLHPIEWSSGTAAGVVAAHMAETKKSTRDCTQSIAAIQELISRQTPILWTNPNSTMR